jgi:hypothetical protein
VKKRARIDVFKAKPEANGILNLISLVMVENAPKQAYESVGRRHDKLSPYQNISDGL